MKETSNIQFQTVVTTEGRVRVEIQKAKPQGVYNM